MLIADRYPCRFPVNDKDAMNIVHPPESTTPRGLYATGGGKHLEFNIVYCRMIQIWYFCRRLGDDIKSGSHDDELPANQRLLGAE